MPFLFILIGLLLVISGARNTVGSLLCLLRGDFAGQNSYFQWAIAIVILGSLGYIKPIQPLMRMFMGLVLVVLFLHEGGVVDNFFIAIEQGPTDATSSSACSQQAATPASTTSGAEQVSYMPSTTSPLVDLPSGGQTSSDSDGLPALPSLPILA